MKAVNEYTKKGGLTILLIVALSLFLANSALASTLTISGTCVDDDFRVSKNGAVNYDGSIIKGCGLVTVNINAICDDKIKLEIKDNKRVRVGFDSIIISHDGFTKSVNGFYYNGALVPAGQKIASHFPSIRYYDTDIDGTKTLVELGLCAAIPNLTVSCSANPTSIQTGQSTTFSSNVSGGTGSYNYLWSGACSGSGQVCANSFPQPGTQTATLTVTSDGKTQSANCSVNVSQAVVNHDYKACYNNNVYWFDSNDIRNDLYQNCVSNQICSSGQCVNQTIACSANTNCGISGYVNNPFCQYGNVYQDFITYTCNNPGTASSTCTNNTAPQLKTTCTGNQTCSNGNCTNQANLVVSSYATPNPANVGQQVSFIATATGGTGSYIYSWTGACAGSGQVCNATFSQSGTQTATVTVASGSQTNTSITTITINQNCVQNSYQRCVGNSVYWYDSCGNQQSQSQYCQYGCSNNSCTNQNCVSNSDRRCVGNSVYWFNSCGNQDGLIQTCNSNQTCQNGACQNQNINYSNLIVDVTAKNLTTGLGWYGNIAASPSDMLMFMITLQAQGNQNTNNVFVRDILPYGLIYKNNLIVSGSSNYSGDITTGIGIGTISAGQTVTITYQAQVAPAGNFSYGTSTLTDNVSVTASGATPNVSNATVTITRSAIYGATTISTGLTNNLLFDSFFLPLMIALLGLWLFRSGIFGFEKWASTKKMAVIGYKAQKQLSARIAKIKEKEKN